MRNMPWSAAVISSECSLRKVVLYYTVAISGRDFATKGN